MSATQAATSPPKSNTTETLGVGAPGSCATHWVLSLHKGGCTMSGSTHGRQVDSTTHTRQGHGQLC